MPRDSYKNDKVIKKSKGRLNTKPRIVVNLGIGVRDGGCFWEGPTGGLQRY